MGAGVKDVFCCSEVHKEVALIWTIINKGVAIYTCLGNESHGKISTEIDKSIPHCSPLSVELVEHMFYNCPLARYGWLYVATII